MKNKVKIIVNSSFLFVTRNTLERNFHFTESYRKSGKNLGVEEIIVFDSLEEYIELLKKGRLKYFNPGLGAIYPALIVEDEKEKYARLSNFCAENNIRFWQITITIYGSSNPTLVFKTGQEAYNKAKHYCIDHDIYVIEGTI
ncbi:MAG: hypothetical protein V3U92_03410 [Cellulophaga sp.]